MLLIGVMKPMLMLTIIVQKELCYTYSGVDWDTAQSTGDVLPRAEACVCFS
jgi:hypothetical protein